MSVLPALGPDLSAAPTDGEGSVSRPVQSTGLEIPTPPVAITGTLILTTTSPFDGESAYRFALDQCDMGPRITGTESGWAAGDYILEQLQNHGWNVLEQKFTYRGVNARNLIAKKGSGPIIMLGAHYDTRPIADKDPDPGQKGTPIIGGNDGASGVAVLLELARVLDVAATRKEIWLAFFDAEDRGNIDGWPYAIGSDYMAKNLEEEPACMLLVDMIGDRDQTIYWERNSHPVLLQEIWEVASKLGYEEYFVAEYRWQITDDHIPFIRRGIPAVDLIDFDYLYWHTTADTCDKVSPNSLARVGHVLHAWLSDRADTCLLLAPSRDR
ncbi:MAG: M28 family peptidase [Candidatus Methanosuratus sp.]|nr:M28 family peptidase [Candidatus Methanosuratincola sp.]